MPALANFIRAELPRRGWKVPEWAPKAKLSLSNAYNIYNGEDNVRRSTFEDIATSFSMTPAELMIAIGKGAGLTPDEVLHLASYREVPESLRPATTDMLRGLAVPPTQHTPKRRSDASSTQRQAAIRKLAGPTPNLPETALDDELQKGYEHLGLLRTIERSLGWQRVGAPLHA